MSIFYLTINYKNPEMKKGKNLMKVIKFFLLIIILSIVQIAVAQSQNSHSNKTRGREILFQEAFEDTLFELRGWYDHLQGDITTLEHIEGSTSSLECLFLQGGTGPVGGTPGRHLFDETDEVYLSYHVKYSSNYTGSNLPYHPHEFHFITNENGMYVGPAWTHLTTYIEQNEGEPLLAIQDGENIDESNIGVDLTEITEERAIAGCNGDSDGYGEGECYSCGAVHCNGKQWRAGSVYFQDEPGPYYKNDWHFIEAYFKLNSIVEGLGICDGIIKYWYDGELIIDHEDIMIRTGEHPDMKFYQFLLAPYIGCGSPVEQTMWIDDLTVATCRPDTNSVDDPYIHNSNTQFVLSQNYPNPFNPETIIEFTTKNTETCPPWRIIIYNIKGQRVKTLNVATRPSTPLRMTQARGNTYTVTWNGTDENNQPVNSGIYFYQLKVNGKTEAVKKCLLLK